MDNSSVNSVSTTASTSAAEQTTAANAVANSNAAAPAADSKTTVNSMSDLREQAPDVYKAMVKGIAMTMINQSQHANDRLIATIRDAEAENNK